MLSRQSVRFTLLFEGWSSNGKDFEFAACFLEGFATGSEFHLWPCLYHGLPDACLIDSVSCLHVCSRDMYALSDAYSTQCMIYLI